MLTLFAIPKPFHGHINTIQRNAIRSWTFLQPSCEIILFGNEAGVAEIADEFNLRHVPHVARNEFGTPLLSDVFAQVSRLATHAVVCYVNSDIILLKDFNYAVQQVTKRKPLFLMVGQRWNIDLDYLWNYTEHDWENKLSAYAKEHAILHAQSGSDYFVFPKATGLTDLPPFAVGRPGWDNWFLFRARQLNIPVVDVTPVTTIIHQNHDYGHIPQQRGIKWEGPEGDQNRLLMGNQLHRFTLLDATHRLTAQGLCPTWENAYLRRRWQTLPILRPQFKPVMQAISHLRRTFASPMTLVEKNKS